MLIAPVINQWFTTSLLSTTVIFDISQMPICLCPHIPYIPKSFGSHLFCVNIRAAHSHMQYTLITNISLILIYFLKQFFFFFFFFFWPLTFFLIYFNFFLNELSRVVFFTEHLVMICYSSRRPIFLQICFESVNRCRHVSMGVWSHLRHWSGCSSIENH